MCPLSNVRKSDSPPKRKNTALSPPSSRSSRARNEGRMSYSTTRKRTTPLHPGRPTGTCATPVGCTVPPVAPITSSSSLLQSTIASTARGQAQRISGLGDNGMPLVVREPHPHDRKLEANLSMPRLQRVSFGGHSHVATFVTTPGACRVLACFAASRRPVPSSREMCPFLMVTTCFRSHAMRMSGCLVKPRYNLKTRWRLARNTRCITCYPMMFFEFL